MQNKRPIMLQCAVLDDFVHDYEFEFTAQNECPAFRAGEERNTCVGCPHVEYTKFSDGTTEWPEEGAADAQ